MRHLVVGCGEVGKALMEVLKCGGYDSVSGYVAWSGGKCDMLHICFPFTNTEQFFRGWVRYYQSLFSPAYTVIHSTVPIGVSDSLNATHSPIRGRHPHLAESIRKFVKYVGGPDAGVVCAEFQRYGLEVKAIESARDTEAGKLLDLMQYANSILLEKEIHHFCGTHGLNFETVYEEFNRSYNSGYAAIGSEQFVRPVLQHQEGPIGGHCVVQNMKHLDTPTAGRVIEVNAKLEVPTECRST